MRFRPAVRRTLALTALMTALAVSPSAHAAAAAPAPAPGPGGARVATLEGFILPGGTTARQLSGEPCAYPNVCEQVAYQNNGSAAGITDGVAKLDKWIRATPGRKIVYGYSLGATVGHAWLRKYNADPTAPAPDQLSFLFVGNPERSVTGNAFSYRNWGNGTGVGIPANLRYSITDVCKKWDGTCYLIKGDIRSTLGIVAIHLTYSNAKINDPKREVRVEGNVTNILLPTPGWG